MRIRPPTLRYVLIAALLLVLFVLASGLRLASAAAPPPPATMVPTAPVPLNRAALIVAYTPDDIRTYCVRFPEEEIGADELLTRAGVVPGISLDGAVCRIGGQGCPVDDCFCQCQDFQDCRAWAFFIWQGNQWFYSQWGVMSDTVVVRDGDMHAWVWEQVGISEVGPPPMVSFDSVCPAAPAATPTPTPMPPLSVPEPGTLTLAATGLGLLTAFVGLRLRRR